MALSVEPVLQGAPFGEVDQCGVELITGEKERVDAAFADIVTMLDSCAESWSAPTP